MRSCPLQRSLGRIKYGLHFLNRHWLDYTWILRFLSLAVKAVGIEVKPSKEFIGINEFCHSLPKDPLIDL